MEPEDVEVAIGAVRTLVRSLIVGTADASANRRVNYFKVDPMFTAFLSKTSNIRGYSALHLSEMMMQVREAAFRTREAPGYNSISSARVKTGPGKLQPTINRIVGHIIDEANKLALVLSIEHEKNQLQRAPSVPEQQIGPYRFKIENDRLSLENQPGGADGLDAQNAARALAGLVDQSERIGQDLARSNCSPRLREAFLIIASKLGSGANIIELAEENGTFSDLIEADDIPSDMLRALLRSHATRIRDYVAQFPEWRAFAANAAEVNFDGEKLREMGKFARATAEKLESQAEYVDASVPKALNTAAKWSEVRRPTGREKLAVSSTILNLLSLATLSLTAVVGTLGVLSTEAKDVAAKVVAVTIVSEITPYLSAISETEDGKWAAPAVKYLRDYLAETTGEK